MYDSRLMRRWNTDPVPTAWESPYAANRNNPIFFNDPDGDIPVGKVLGKIWGGIKQFGKNIGSIFTNRKWGAKGGKLVGKVKDVDKVSRWRGLANIFKSPEAIGLTARWGKRVNNDWQTVATNVLISGQGNPIDRTDLYDFGSQLPRYKDRIIGLEITGNTNGGWGSFLRAKGSNGKGRGWSIANTGLQNILPTWQIIEGKPIDDFEARSGIVPGTNLLPTIYAYAFRPVGLVYGALAGTVGYLTNSFNSVSPLLKPVKAVEIQYRSISNIPATYTMRIKTRTTIKRDPSLWRKLWYGY